MSQAKYNHVSDSHGDLDLDGIEGSVIDTGDIIDMGEYGSVPERAQALDAEMAARNDYEDEFFLTPGNHDMTGEHGNAPTYEEVTHRLKMT